MPVGRELRVESDLRFAHVDQLEAERRVLDQFSSVPLNYSLCIQQTLDSELLFICLLIYSFNKHLLSTGQIARTGPCRMRSRNSKWRILGSQGWSRITGQLSTMAEMVCQSLNHTFDLMLYCPSRMIRGQMLAWGSSPCRTAGAC